MSDRIKGIITKGIGGFYYVKTLEGLMVTRGRGNLKRDGRTLLVGDQVIISRIEDNQGVVEELLERKNSLIRPPISNIDLLVVVVSAKKPKLNLGILDRLLVNGEVSSIKPIICLNKSEENKGETLESIEKIKGSYEGIYPWVDVSGKTGRHMDRLIDLIANKTVAFAGPSGVGKSTIVNSLFPEAQMETGKISEKNSRGKHTTRHVEIFQGPKNSLIFDTPGFTSIDAPNIKAEELKDYFPEFVSGEGQCRFDNCNHIKEPACNIIRLVKDGIISESRYNSYLTIYKELCNRKKY